MWCSVPVNFMRLKEKIKRPNDMVDLKGQILKWHQRKPRPLSQRPVEIFLLEAQASMEFFPQFKKIMWLMHSIFTMRVFFGRKKMWSHTVSHFWLLTFLDTVKPILATTEVESRRPQTFATIATTSFLSGENNVFGHLLLSAFSLPTAPNENPFWKKSILK